MEIISIRHMTTKDVEDMASIKHVPETFVYDTCLDTAEDGGDDQFRDEDAIVAEIRFTTSDPSEGCDFRVYHGYFGDNSNGILLSNAPNEEFVTEFGEGIREVSETCPEQYRDVARQFVRWIDDDDERSQMFIIHKVD